MARKDSEIRRQELIQIAFGQFLKNGYEKTSIRSIVGEAGGEIGMFYHYFSSKDAIFYAVLEEYNKAYLEKINTLIKDNEELSFWQVMDLILNDLEQSLSEYKKMNNEMMDQGVLQRLHQGVLIQLVPCFESLFNEYIKRGEILSSNIGTKVITHFVLFGMSAVIHMEDRRSIAQKHQDIILLLKKVFNDK